MYNYNFEKLEIWQLAMQLSVDIHPLTKSFPSEEKFGISSQLRQASSSISANIAECTSRIRTKARGRFIEIAYDSAIEVLNFLILSHKLSYINGEKLVEFRDRISKLTNRMNAFHKSLARLTILTN